jgi:cell division septal protein FtsQ
VRTARVLRRLRGALKRTRAGAARARGASWRFLRRRWRGVATTAVLAVALGAGIAERAPLTRWVLEHPYFAVSEIVVSPTKRVREGVLLQWVGIRPGMSIWTLEPRALERRLEEHPWIRRARVERELPRRLTIEVAEREAAAVVMIDQLYYVDRGGAVFARVGSDESLDLPFVTGIEAAVVNGEQPYPRHAVRQAVKLLDLMGRAGLPFRVSEVHIDRERGITVFPVEPQIELAVGWGRFPEKLARLREVLSGFAGREAQLRGVDLTLESQVVVRLRQGGGSDRASTKHVRA